MRSSNNYAILCNGEFPCREQVRRRLLESDVLVCCDGAAEALAGYRVPDAVVGDMDSISPELACRYAGRQVRVAEQESNDMTKAYRHVLSMHDGMSPGTPFSVTFYGAGGKREDHTIGNVSLLADYAWEAFTEGRPVTLSMVSDHGSFFPLTDSVSFCLPEGTPVSIFSFDSTVEISSEGLQYPTSGVVFDKWWKATLNRVSDRNILLSFSHPAPVLIYVAGYFGENLLYLRHV